MSKGSPRTRGACSRYALGEIVASIALLLSASVLPAQTGTAKRDTTKAATKAPAATAKPSSTTKPSTTTKPATTAAPAATSGGASAKPATTAKPAGGAVAPTGTPAAGTRAPAPAARPASTTAAARPRAPIGKPTPYDEGGAALYAGMAVPSLSFSAGPAAGLAWRRPLLAPPIALRLDVGGSHHTQPTTVSGLTAGTLTHVGASAGLEFTLSKGPGVRPYVGASVGVYRFQASGPAGKAAINAGDILASTTDVAGIATAGVRFASRFFVEARYLTVGDFTSMPITVGVRF